MLDDACVCGVRAQGSALPCIGSSTCCCIGLMISCTTPVYETAMTVLAKRTALLSPLASFPSAVLRTARVLQTAEPETLRNGVLPSFLNYPLLPICCLWYGLVDFRALLIILIKCC